MGSRVDGATPATAAATVSAGDAGDAIGADNSPEHFAEAVAMLARLPLTDAERAEAVRRLLAQEGGGKR